MNVKPSEWYIYQPQGAKMVEQLVESVTTALPQMALHTAEVVWADNGLKNGAIISKLKEIKRSTWGSCLRPSTDRQNARTVSSERHAPTTSSEMQLPHGSV